jgi:hypothetical protein
MQDKRKTKVVTNGEEYTFDGFILMSHQQLHHVPPFCFQQYGYSYQMKLEPANEVVAVRAQYITLSTGPRLSFHVCADVHCIGCITV